MLIFSSKDMRYRPQNLVHWYSEVTTMTSVTRLFCTAGFCAQSPKSIKQTFSSSLSFATSPCTVLAQFLHSLYKVPAKPLRSPYTVQSCAIYDVHCTIVQALYFSHTVVCSDPSTLSGVGCIACTAHIAQSFHSQYQSVQIKHYWLKWIKMATNLLNTNGVLLFSQNMDVLVKQ